ncbi:alpha/beta fold hydrolase [Streptomyces caniscabiei]|uniref:Alpha/beta hydrolase n=1 Tax=Streptomyces caniscabiei TaxID=2746961 RepID=A0ABU4MW65_9ACTN|nr:alpha/beta hydrolase [Streptomyces caniscabiei]MBE4733895.1 alpha/beta hydrolase [Streptomyces caniscabiei]MBE4755072.1 alpha/beta hydrolase [Streptomyces caniscabiei]MBE4768108.1 alpha/beta hydrolase [Streptomyces caniscabiei]MBE4782390.1 alpha/beta hydrolase [Streptomyces caniscabiei]MBE4793678.1 alpha/beta hydrolase [Streptomyces caniscabiei]
MPYVTAADGAQIFYKDWGQGRPVVLSHGWPLNSDSWEAQQLFLARHGFRVVAHDRRGHGRSTQTWHGNEMNTYADDLATLIDTLDLRDVTLVGFSTGGGEVARYVGRHGTGRVAQLVLVSAVPPFMLRTEDNPDGLPVEVFDAIRAGSLADRSQLYRDLADGPFFGNNRPGAEVSQGVRDAFWLQGLQSGHRNAYECVAAFSATDFRADLDAVDVPALVIHGDDDQVVPFEVGGRASAARIKNATLKVYPGAPHGITDTHKDQLGADLLEFLNS